MSKNAVFERNLNQIDARNYVVICSVKSKTKRSIVNPSKKKQSKMDFNVMDSTKNNYSLVIRILLSMQMIIQRTPKHTSGDSQLTADSVFVCNAVNEIRSTRMSRQSVIAGIYCY